jgi:hypothetical protein
MPHRRLTRIEGGRDTVLGRSHKLEQFLARYDQSEPLALIATSNIGKSHAEGLGLRPERTGSGMKHYFPATLGKHNARESTVDHEHEIVDTVGSDIRRRSIAPGDGGLMVAKTDRPKYGKFRPRHERAATHGDGPAPAELLVHKISPARETRPVVKLGREIGG